MFKRYSLILILCILVIPAFAVNSAQAKGTKIILHFKTMFGVDDPFLSTPPPDPCVGSACDPLPTDPRLRGVFGDYESWKIAKSVEGKLFSDGKLIINIKGLIFGDGSPNDEENFRALVSCRVNPDGAPDTFSPPIITEPFPVHKPISKGNANIKAKIDLPNPCLAPVVMILSGDEDVWFAVTGF